MYVKGATSWVCAYVASLMILSQSCAGELINNELQDLRDRLHQQQKYFEGKLSEVTREVADLREEVDRCRYTTNTPIGFTAFNDDGDTSIGSGTVIPFRAATFNAGSAYDVSTFMFTCPVRGIYMFSVNAFSKSALDVSIWMGEDTVIGNAKFREDDSVDGMASNTVFAECGVGEQVRVISNGARMGEDGANRRDSFSGYLLQLL